MATFSNKQDKIKSIYQESFCIVYLLDEVELSHGEKNGVRVRGRLRVKAPSLNESVTPSTSLGLSFLIRGMGGSHLTKWI